MLQRLAILFDFRGSLQYLPNLLSGAAVSLELTIVVMALSLILGLFVALARMTRLRLVRTASTVYVEAIRGTPSLLQLIYIYYVLPVFGITLPPFWAAVVALTINYSAYLSEVYRAGIQAVGRGQLEASQALGMSRSWMMRLIILPQAIRIIVPPLGNYLMSLFKDTSLASVITVREMLFTGEVMASTNFQYFTILTIVGVIYLALSYPGSLGVQYLERRMRIGYRPRIRSMRSAPSVP